MPWAPRSALPVGRGWIGGRIARADGKYHFVGGVTSGDGIGSTHARSNRTDQFDAVTNTWTAKANYPTFISWHCLDGDGQFVFVFGGASRVDGAAGSSGNFRVLNCYDPVGNVWKQLSMPLLAPIAGGSTAWKFAMTQVDGDLYLSATSGKTPIKIVVDVAGGTAAMTALNPTGFDYANKWLAGGQMLSASDDDGNIYMLQTSVSSLAKYDRIANTLVEVSVVPGFLAGSSGTPTTLTWVRDRLRLMGGTDVSFGTPDQWKQQWLYDPSINTWTRSEDCPIGFSAHASCETLENGSLLVAGGMTATPSTTYRTEVYETQLPSVDAPVMLLLGDSLINVDPWAFGTVLGDSFITGDLDAAFGTTITPGILATGIPV